MSRHGQGKASTPTKIQAWYMAGLNHKNVKIMIKRQASTTKIVLATEADLYPIPSRRHGSTSNSIPPRRQGSTATPMLFLLGDRVRPLPLFLLGDNGRPLPLFLIDDKGQPLPPFLLDDMG